MCRNPLEPQTETSVNIFVPDCSSPSLVTKTSPLFSVGLHFVYDTVLLTGLHFKHNLIHIRLCRRQAQASHCHRTFDEQLGATASRNFLQMST